MDYSYQYAIIGGDMRQVHLVEQLALEGASVCYYNLCSTPTLPNSQNLNVSCAVSLKEICNKSLSIIGPIPFEKKKHLSSLFSVPSKITLSELLSYLKSGQYLFGGNLPLDFVKKAKDKGILVTDFLKCPNFVYSNTIATAEGIVCEAIKASPITLKNSRCAILGYGRCGTTLLWYLKAMGCNISVFSNDETECAKACIGAENTGNLLSFSKKAEQFDYIFNTIPALIITSEILSTLKSQVTILDLASAPGGVDYQAAEKLKIRAIFCPGLPGKYAPVTSAMAMKQEIQVVLST